MRIWAMLPTYNEADNIQPLIQEILALGPQYEVLVVDDDSPDGTWKIVGDMARLDPRVHLRRRVGERGRGTAGAAGLLEAARQGADLVVEMDADFSHHPRFIPSLVEAAREADVVVGSRLVPGGGERGRSPLRTLITHLASFYIRRVLGLPVRDCTSGFRVFRREALARMHLDQMTSKGPAIVQEIFLAARRAGCRFAEVPILFEERRAGQSTFNFKIMLAGLLSVLKFRFRRPRH